MNGFDEPKGEDVKNIANRYNIDFMATSQNKLNSQENNIITNTIIACYTLVVKHIT